MSSSRPRVAAEGTPAVPSALIRSVGLDSDAAQARAFAVAGASAVVVAVAVAVVGRSHGSVGPRGRELPPAVVGDKRPVKHEVHQVGHVGSDRRHAAGDARARGTPLEPELAKRAGTVTAASSTTAVREVAWPVCEVLEHVVGDR